MPEDSESIKERNYEADIDRYMSEIEAEVGTSRTEEIIGRINSELFPDSKNSGKSPASVVSNFTDNMKNSLGIQTSYKLALGLKKQIISQWIGRSGEMSFLKGKPKLTPSEQNELKDYKTWFNGECLETFTSFSKNYLSYLQAMEADGKQKVTPHQKKEAAAPEIASTNAQLAQQSQDKHPGIFLEEGQKYTFSQGDREYQMTYTGQNSSAPGILDNIALSTLWHYNEKDHFGYGSTAATFTPSEVRNFREKISQSPDKHKIIPANCELVSLAELPEPMLQQAMSDFLKIKENPFSGKKHPVLACLVKTDNGKKTAELTLDNPLCKVASNFLKEAEEQRDNHLQSIEATNPGKRTPLPSHNNEDKRSGTSIQSRNNAPSK